MAMSIRTTQIHLLPPLTRLLSRGVLLARAWEYRRATRRKLRNLPQYLLEDIGLSPAAAAAEVEKPFWKP